MSRDGAIALALLFIAVLLAGALISHAHAHGEAVWIQEGGYVDQAGIHCCGPTDCHRAQAVGFREAPEGIWVTTGAGDEILMKRELIGRGLYPSIDDDWWICIRGGEVKCVFKPTTGG